MADDAAHVTDLPDDWNYTEMFPLGSDETEYRLVSTDGVSTFDTPEGTFLKIEPEAIRRLTAEAMRDIAHYLRSSHLQQLRNILDDPEASDNDHFVALDLLKNASIAAGGVLPMCQDTGTAIVKGKKGQMVFTGGGDEEQIAHGIADTYLTSNLRYSQMAPLDMYTEKNTGTNLPAEIKINAIDGDAYKFLFMAKGGGSANKSYLFQETKALLNEATLLPWIFDKIQAIGTSACPPYHLAIVIGGTSAELAVETAKLAQHEATSTRCRPPDRNRVMRSAISISRRRSSNWPRTPASALSSAGSTSATTSGSSAFPDTAPRARSAWPCRARQIVRRWGRSPLTDCSSNNSRPIRLASCPSSTPRSCSAPSRCTSTSTGRWTRSAPTLAELPVTTQVMLTGPMIVARDIAHAKIKERLDAGEEMPQYWKDHAVYYAGPAKTPEGYASGSFGPTTAGRMDSYVPEFQAAGGSMVMLAKGNRSEQVTDSCNENGGFYLGSIGGPAARLALDNIKQVDVLEYPELGMEAIWKIEVENFPAFIVVDDKGNDFYAKVRAEASMPVGITKPARSADEETAHFGDEDAAPDA